MNRTEILKKANDLTSVERDREYGDAKTNFDQIGRGWSEILGVDVPAWKVALCMDWLKTCRALHDPKKQDNWVDKAGYVALGGEISLSEKDKSGANDPALSHPSPPPHSIKKGEPK
jgi:hypothetical protein